MCHLLHPFILGIGAKTTSMYRNFQFEQSSTPQTNNIVANKFLRLQNAQITPLFNQNLWLELLQSNPNYLINFLFLNDQMVANAQHHSENQFLVKLILYFSNFI